MSKNKAVYRTAPPTPGLLITLDNIIGKPSYQKNQIIFGHCPKLESDKLNKESTSLSTFSFTFFKTHSSSAVLQNLRNYDMDRVTLLLWDIDLYESHYIKNQNLVPSHKKA